MECERAMDAFARIHAFWWDHADLGQIDEAPSEESTAAYVTSIQECFPRFADALGGSLPIAGRSVYERVLPELSRLFERVSRGTGLTLIHGDAHWRNVLVPRDPTKDGALIIDWQLWGISFGAEDLANLIALQWSAERRAEMEHDLLGRYYHGLVRGGVEGYTWDDCWADYRLAVVTRALFMPMWQWSSGQARDRWWGNLERTLWAFEDLHCAELLGS
jgi:hypothetical protein